ncbi:MAG TPA: DHH family phosphoesterase [Pirellulaceae bacterium]|nr:DHH family phosphoesterase [Pirellulaceae bacterium]
MRSKQRFLLTSHIRPDCDALGSELGMAGVLEALGKEVTIANGHATPPNLAFIDPLKKIKTLGVDVQPAELMRGFDALIILDTSAFAQLGAMTEVVQGTDAMKLLVDHHVGEDDLKAEHFKNTTAEATGRLVMEAADALKVTLTPEIAMPLFAAIATDTGWFRFGSAGSGTYRLAAQLIDAGAKASSIYADLYERDTLGRVKLRGLILSRVVTEFDGQLVHTYALKEDFTATGALPSDTEDVINLALAIEGTQFAVIFVEQASGGFKISFRSRCKLDCSQIASKFGGGGHKAASGAFVVGDYATASQQVLDVVRAAMR